VRLSAFGTFGTISQTLHHIVQWDEI